MDLTDPAHPVKGFGKIDRLNYIYGEMPYRTNRLLAVDDDVIDNNAAMDFFDDGNIYGHFDPFRPSEYYYDANQNLIKDVNKGMEVRYNHANLPTEIRLNGGEIKNYYDGLGNKIREESYTSGSMTQSTDYVDGYLYIDERFNSFPFPEGRIVYDGSTVNRLFPEYHLRDHLGNMRVAFRAFYPDIFSFGKRI
jgi:YD repeat-containing protein